MQERNHIFNNFIWRLLERFGAQAVTLVVTIILSRLLDPVVYGTVALITVITSILQVFVDSGLGNALIQKINADDLDFSSVFYFNCIAGLVLYGLLFVTAPAISNFYNRGELTSIIRVMGLMLLIASVKNVQNAYVSRNLMFKKYFFATLGGTITAAVVGIILAANGYGVWALIIQNLANQFIDTVILWLTVPWRPKWMFSFKRLGRLWSYGWKLLCSALLDTTYTQLRQLIIGKKYTSEDLAFYNKGHTFPATATTSIVSSIDSVLFPVMAKEQNNVEMVKRMTRRAIKTSSFCIWPMMMGLAAIADDLVPWLMTDKWIPAIPYLRIFCITYAFYPIHTANLNAIKAMGRSDIFLKLEIIKKLYGIAIILISMWFGVYVLALSCLLSSVISQIINSWPNRKLLGYKYEEQLLDLLPSLLLALAMGVIVYCVRFLGLSHFVTLVIQIPLGVVVYFALAKLFKVDSLEYCYSTVKEIISKRGRKN